MVYENRKWDLPGGLHRPERSMEMVVEGLIVVWSGLSSKCSTKGLCGIWDEEEEENDEESGRV